MTARPSVIELRRYTLHPGARETLIGLFDSELIEPQEALGMRVLGQFRDLAAPDSFVWLRGFQDMRSRRRALESFYGGPVWRRHRDAANATMIDSDDVVLLRPAGPNGWAAPAEATRPQIGAAQLSHGLFVLTTYHLHPAASGEFARIFAAEIEPVLTAAGGTVLARLQTEHAHNDFPALPVRADTDVFVSLVRFEAEDGRARHAVDLADAGRNTRVHDRLSRPPETARLVPTERSALQ